MKRYINKTTRELNDFEADGSQDYLITSDMVVCQKDANGNYYKAYNADGTPDFNAIALLDAPVVPEVVTMRQARLALLQSGLLQTVTDAIATGTDEAIKIEWEYATDVKRDWPSLVALTTSLGITDADLDNLFTLAATL